MKSIRRVYNVNTACNIDNLYITNFKGDVNIMKIKRIQIKPYYSYCRKCGRSVDSNDLYYYNGLCQYCWRGRYYE